jgi:3-phenylpropionate/trans-cinnamate dioxygenase ferredoxin subunit
MSTSSAVEISLAGLEESKPHRVVVEGVPICLVRFGDEVRAIHDTCSHQDWTLSDGMVYDRAVECDLHGSCFDMDTGVPTTLPAIRPVPTYAVVIDGDTVTVDVSTALNGADAPDH